MVSGKWWTEDRRGNLIGHGVRWGNRWAHLTRIIDGGPGANDIRPICNGIQSVVLISSALDVKDQQACEAWKQGCVDIPLGSLLEDIIKPRRLANICPKCRAGYERHLTKMGEQP